MNDRPDSEVLAFAAENGFLLISHDVNTMPAEASARIAAAQPMCGLFMVRQTQPIAPAIEARVLIWSASESEEWQNQIRFPPF